MNTTRDEAVRLSELGISLIRLPRGKKRPPLEGRSWVRFTKRRRSPKEARRAVLFGMNIAIVTGPVSGLVGVDCDSDAAERWALSNLPPSPMMTRTPRGGLHIYFAYPRAGVVRCGAKLRGMSLDVRGTNGYLLCPTSSDENGTEYCWLGGPPTKEMLESLPVFDPSWLETSDKRQRAPVVPRHAHPGTARIRARSYIGEIVAEAGRGGHNTTYRAACILREFGLSAAAALEELTLWNRTNALPPWSAQELLHKVESCFGERPDMQPHHHRTPRRCYRFMDRSAPCPEDRPSSEEVEIRGEQE